MMPGDTATKSTAEKGVTKLKLLKGNENAEG